MRRSSRVPDAARRSAWWLSTPIGMVTIFGAGLALRIVLARGGGFPFDMDSFAAWAQRLAERGPWNFYPRGGETFFVDYPPGYLYVLYLVGLAAKAAGRGAPSVFLLKLGPVLGDLVLAWVVSRLAVRLAPAWRRVPVQGIAACAILFNPAVFFVSATWGQVDCFLAILVGASLLCLVDRPTFGREAAGMALLAAAVATKPQALFVVPSVVLLLVWRHLAAPAERRSVPAGVGRVLGAGAVGAVAGVAILAPFRLASPSGALSFYTKAASTYDVTSVFAFNLWGAVGFWRHDVGHADAVRVFGVPAFYVALAAFAGAIALVLYRSWRALSDGWHEGRVLVFSSTASVLVAFTTLTRIHERYLFLAVALLAVFVVFPGMRRAFVAISALYYVNVFFPYVYYLRFVHRPSPGLGGLFDAFYGTEIGGVRLRLLAAATGVVCLVVAWTGWRRLEAVAPASEIAGAPVPPPVIVPPSAAAREAEAAGRWQLQLHPITHRGVWLALGVFVVAFVSRLAGLGHPPGMYFDEVYHARTGAEYLNHKEVYEWTHPPLAKEIIGFSIQHASRFSVSRPAALPTEVRPDLITNDETDVVWATTSGRRAELQRGQVDRACRLRPDDSAVRLDLQVDALAASGGRVFVAGRRDGAPMVVRLDGEKEVWNARLDQPAKSLAALDDTAFVVGRDGTLVFLNGEGDARGVAVGAGSVVASKRAGEAWVTFPGTGRVASWNQTGNRSAVVVIGAKPRGLVEPPGSDRVVVATDTGSLQLVDSEGDRVDATMPGGADLVGTVPETALAWATEGTDVRVIEPRGATVIGRQTLPFPPMAVFGDPLRHRLVAARPGELACVGGHPTFAWRLGSAIAGSVMVALVFLLVLRLFGNVGAGLLASLFLTVDGLAFTMSRIAMNDSYASAFILAAWFCALSALYRWEPDDDSESSRPWALFWLLGTGVCAGLALASKWPGLYALSGIGILLLWDGFANGAKSLWRVAGRFVPSVIVIGLVVGAVPLAIYVLSYVPYFTLGHSFGDLLVLQRNMYNYHAHLTATHPFGSPWYGWPFGHKAVYLYLADHMLERSEMWTIPNPVVFIGGGASMVWAAVSAWRWRSAALAVVVWAAAVQYLPWATVTRVTFLYHYLPVVPMLAIALGWFLTEGTRDLPYRRQLAAVVALGAVAFFFAVLPMLEGWSMSTTYLDAVKRALPWVLP